MAHTSVATPPRSAVVSNPVYQAYHILHIGFIVAPVLARLSETVAP